MPSAVLDAASITPEIGFRMSPPSPLAVPKRNPGRPYFFAPLAG